jgi:hypothetical protein
MFAGPKIQPVMEAFAPGLELTVDYSWLTIIAKMIYWLLEPDLQLCRQLGSGDFGRDLHHQGAVLQAVESQLPVDGKNAQNSAAPERIARTLRRRPPEVQYRNDGHVQTREGQPAGRLFADPGADSGVHFACIGY